LLGFKSVIILFFYFKIKYLIRFGQLGDGTNEDKSSPKQIASKDISGQLFDGSKSLHSCANFYYDCFSYLSNNPLVCSSHGICVSKDTCSCLKNYRGLSCNVTSCFGIDSNDASVCSGHGNCDDFDKCKCEFSFSGTDCNINNVILIEVITGIIALVSFGVCVCCCLIFCVLFGGCAFSCCLRKRNDYESLDKQSYFFQFLKEIFGF
jgi:hypothetical protein